MYCFEFGEIKAEMISLVLFMLSDLDRFAVMCKHWSYEHDDNNDSRIADVDPRVNLMAVFGRPAVEAALVRQQIIELLERNLEARHVESIRSRCLYLLVGFILHIPPFPLPEKKKNRITPHRRRRRKVVNVAERCWFTGLRGVKGSSCLPQL